MYSSVYSVQKHPALIHHERRLHRLMLTDELRCYERDFERAPSASPNRTAPSSREGSVRGGTLTAKGAARAEDLLRTLGTAAFVTATDPTQVIPNTLFGVEKELCRWRVAASAFLHYTSLASVLLGYLTPNVAVNVRMHLRRRLFVRC
jgi:hypothetical protein